MLRIRVVSIGKDKDRWVSDALAHFEKQLRRYARIEWINVAGAKSANLSPDEQKREEADQLRKHVDGHFTIALSDRGQSVDSHAFAKLLESWQTRCRGDLTFVIGGPYGIADDLLSAADEVLSLSPLTFSHQLVRLVLAEQLFRGLDILHGGSYHK